MRYVYIQIYGTFTKYGQIAPSPPGRLFASICAISSLVSSNPNTSALFLMRSGLSLFGSGTNPRCSDQRTRTCVVETPCALAIATSVGSSFLVARTRGAYACGCHVVVMLWNRGGGSHLDDDAPLLAVLDDWGLLAPGMDLEAISVCEWWYVKNRLHRPQSGSLPE